jgi:putative ABC transport system substrate-binding protein
LAPIDRANEQAAQEVGLQATIFKLPAGPNPDLEGAFRSIAANGAEAVLVLETPVPFAHRNRIAQIASANRMPTMVPGGQSETGGLITYGTSVVASWPMMVDMAHKILKGASPATIAVEAVNRRELIINMKTARELGVVVPEAVLKRSDKVIE